MDGARTVTPSEVPNTVYTPNRQSIPLVERHRRMLFEESGLSPGIVGERGYRTVRSRAELLEFPKKQRRLGLYVPMYSPDGETTLAQIRPYNPRKDKQDKPIKYETPSKSKMIIDVHPSMLDRVRRSHTPLWVTEGVKCGDSLASRGLPAVALAGVWMFAVKDTHGCKLLPCWDYIRLEGRRVNIVYDSDVMCKVEVQRALERLVTALEERGADVRVVYLPDAEDGSKLGVDDYLSAGGTVNELTTLARNFDPVEIGQIRLSRDEKLRALVSEAKSRGEDEDWTRFFGTADRPNKTRGHSCRDMIEVAIEQVTKSGKVVADGLEFSVDVRTWAERAELSRQSIMKNIPHLEATNWLRRVEGDRGSGKAATYVLLIPRANLDQYRSKEQEERELRGQAEREFKARYSLFGQGLRAPRRRWSAPTFDREGDRIIRGYVHRHGKVCGHALYHVLNKGDGRMSVNELAALLNVQRPRELTRRKSDGDGRDGELTRLENAGIIVIEDGYVEKTDNWREALDNERLLKGEIAAGERQRTKHSRQRKGYREWLALSPEERKAMKEQRKRARADGFIGDLRPADEPEERQPEPDVSELAGAIHEYLDANPRDACQPPGWLGTTVWAYGFYPERPTPAEAQAAIAELGEGYLRGLMERTRAAA